MRNVCTLSDVEFMPIRELKTHILHLGGDPSKCLEKRDLKKCLCLLIIDNMSAPEVKEYIVLLSFSSSDAVSQEVLCEAAGAGAGDTPSSSSTLLATAFCMRWSSYSMRESWQDSQ